MKQISLRLIVASLFCVLAGSQVAPPKNYRISGVVIDRATGQRLARVRIVMNPAGDSSKTTETITSADGQFAFDKVSAGMWSLYAERKGFPRQGFGERPGVPDSFTQVVAGPEGNSEGLTFPLDAPAVVTGRITDEDGEPVIAALEIIIQLETGIHSFQRIRNAATDEQGQYRIYDLPAVPCYLLAVAPTPPAEDGEQAPPTFAPTYYANTADPSAATLLDLQPGREYRADFVMRRTRGAAIHIEGDLGGNLAMLSAAGPRGAEVIVGQLDAGEGRSFYNLPPGHYKLTLFDQRTGDHATKSIEISSSDVTVQAPFRDAPSVTAKVQLVDADPSLLSKITFYLHADGDYQTHARTVGADGTVTIPGMTAGRYKFMLATAGVYIKSLTSENGPATDRIIEVPETGTVKLKVVVAGDGGEVAGKLRVDGKPVAPARVVLAPRNGSTNSADYLSYQTETDGSFRYRSVRPGDYLLFATADWKMEFGNPAVLGKYLSAAKAVHVEPRASIEANLNQVQ